jgi:hypothetical protein
MITQRADQVEHHTAKSVFNKHRLHNLEFRLVWCPLVVFTVYLPGGIFAHPETGRDWAGKAANHFQKTAEVRWAQLETANLRC